MCSSDLHLTGKHKDSGSDVKSPFVHVWRMSDGKAKRVQALVDTHEILKASGGSGSAGGGSNGDNSPGDF